MQIAGRDADPDLQRALEMVRLSAAALRAGVHSIAEGFLREAEQSLLALHASKATRLAWSPPMHHGALGEALTQIIAALQRADAAIAAEEPQELPIVDGLTGLPSYKAFQQHLVELAASAPLTETCWLLIADIDDFKALNDRHGHPTGDAYLAAVAGLARTLLSPPHYLARAGGEKFAAVLCDLTMEQAHSLAEDIREAVEELQQPADATLSVGLAGWLPATEPAQQAYLRADRALEAAKRAGGNCVEVSGSDDGPPGS
jgi:diguanylate cyclase (GGDEF)-like protein